LRASMIEAWRGHLPMRPQGVVPIPGKRILDSLAPTSIDKLLTDLRAALNMAGLKHRRELPAAFAQEVRVGTKAINAPTDARRQLLSDDQIRTVVESAFEIDDSGDFGRVVLLAAATGARFSQLAALKVGDVQVQRGRVMVPGSSKGRSKKPKPPTAVPLSNETVLRLLPAVQGRAVSEPLLMRWQHRLVGRYTWARDFRCPWGPAYEVGRYWPKAVRRAGLPPETVMYALRHSSIVRGLRAMLPVRLVAALHDTSVAMIEQYYAAFIVDVTEDLARRAVISFTPDAASPREAA
jgi:integrase